MMKPPIVVAALSVLAAVAYSAYNHRRGRPVSTSEDPSLTRWEGEGGQAVARERSDTRFAAEGGPTESHDTEEVP